MLFVLGDAQRADNSRDSSVEVDHLIGYVCIRMQIHRIQFQKGYVDCKETAVDHWILFHFD